MVFALLLLPIAAVLGYINHRQRIRSLEREFNARISDQVSDQTSRRADADRKADESTTPGRAKSQVLIRMPSDAREPLVAMATPLQAAAALDEPADSDDGIIERMMPVRPGQEKLSVDGQAEAVNTSSKERHAVSFDQPESSDERQLPHQHVSAEKKVASGLEEASDKATTVLIVDDHPGTRGYLAYALRKHHNIVEASNGAEALALIKKIDPDLVISDIMMPVMDGNELCRSVKSDASLSHIPIFLVTANAVTTLKMEGLQLGADDYLLKPFDLEEAVMRINNEIRSRSELRRRFSREVVIRPSDIIVTSADEAFLNRARDIVEENMEDGNFGVQDLASEFALSSRQLQRRLRETVDQSPVEFIRVMRLHRAAQLLEGHFGNVSEVAYSVGFTSLSYFAKCFREQFGLSPSEFKAKEAA